MSQPPRFAPPTQLDALRRLLGGYYEGDRSFEAQFYKSLLTLQQQSLPLLGRRLFRTTTPRSLRSLILKVTTTFDWPEWDLHLMHMLQTEEDLALFEEGCAALGGLCTHRALEGLQRLKGIRRDPERQQILDQELAPYQPQHPLEVYVAALTEGEANPDLARQGARGLIALAAADQLPTLVGLFHQGNALTRHLLLQVLTFFRDAIAERVLIELFTKVKEDILDLLKLGDILPALKVGTREALQQSLLAILEERFAARAPEARPPEAVSGLRLALADKSRHPDAELELVQTAALGPLETLLVKALHLQIEGKTLSYHGLLSQTTKAIPGLKSELAALLDDIAGHLVAKVEAGQLPLEEALPLLEEAFHGSMGGEGLLISYLSLLPSEEKTRLERLLEWADPDLRKRCIEALGAREEDRLVPFFLKAMNDPMRDVSMVAIHQIGKLPSGFEAMMGLFRSGQVDRMREAIHFFGENQTQAAAKTLMGFLATENPDDLLVDAAHALGRIADPATTNALLNQLHSGKPLLLQVALAEALAQIRTPVASLGLLKKSEVLIFPQVRVLALEGALSAFPDFHTPFPPDQIPALEHLAGVCCDEREGAGQWMTVTQIMEGLYVFDPGIFTRLAELFSGFLSGMPLHTRRDRESHDRVADLIRELTRRAENLTCMEEREQALQTLMDEFSSATGAKRLPPLTHIQEILADPWIILSVPFFQAFGTFLRGALARESSNLQEVENLCVIAGLTGLQDLVGPLRDIYTRATNPDIKLAARKALLALGLLEKEIDLRAPVKSLLLIEPNAFFRKRLGAALAGKDWSLAMAANRQEAEDILANTPVDLLITESQDEQGDMGIWIASIWDKRQCRYVLLSASHHNPEFLADKPWVVGRLYKPYPVEEILKAIEG